MSKTIELTDHAYARLKAARQDDESWSDVVERCVKPKQTTAEVLRAIKRSALSLQVLDEAEKSITRRRRLSRTRKV